jgi:uncharacterized protein (DUF3820 family)
MSESTIYEAVTAELSKTFDPQLVQWKPGAVSRDKTRAMAMAYVDSRPYMERLDAVAPGQWEDRYEVFAAADRVVVVCHLTVCGVTKAGDGECLLSNGRGEPEPNAVTSASAQAFKRACTKHGLGRYLYDLPRRWVDYDADKRFFTRDGLATLMAMLADGPPPKQSHPDADSTATSGSNGNAAAIEIKFGKYNGRTLRWIATEAPEGEGPGDLDYLDWLAKEWKWDKGRQAAAAVLAHYQAQQQRPEQCPEQCPELAEGLAEGPVEGPAEAPGPLAQGQRAVEAPF